MRRTPGGSGCRRRAPAMPGWGRPAWCSMTSAPCISRPMRVTGSVSQGSRRSGGLSRRSHRPAHRSGRLPAHGQCLRAEQGRDQDDAAGHRVVYGRARPAGRHRRRGRRDGVRGESEGHRGPRPVVHPRHEDPAHPLCPEAVAARAPRPGHPRRARAHPAVARRAERRAMSRTCAPAPTARP
jgi:hypothetical protein